MSTGGLCRVSRVLLTSAVAVVGPLLTLRLGRDGAWPRVRGTSTRRGTGDLMGTLLRAPRRVLGPGRTGTPGSPMRPTHAGHTLAALATMDSSLHDQSVRGRQGPLVTRKSDS